MAGNNHKHNCKCAFCKPKKLTNNSLKKKVIKKKVSPSKNKKK